MDSRGAGASKGESNCNELWDALSCRAGLVCQGHCEIAEGEGKQLQVPLGYNTANGGSKVDRNVTGRVRALPRHTHPAFHRNSEESLLVTFIPKHKIMSKYILDDIKWDELSK